MKKFLCIVFLFTLFVLPAGSASAGLLFVPNTYGLSPKSIGLGNAMAGVGDDYSMAYYNPGAMSTFKTSQVDAGYLFAAPRMKGGPTEGGSDIEYKANNKIALIGFTMNLSQVFKNKHGLGLGFDMAVDNNMKSFMNFEETRNNNGQFIRWGLSSVTMAFGAGVKIIDQIHVGGGGYIMIKGKNTLVAETDLAGKTANEEIQVSAQPAIAPIFGIYAPVHRVVTIGATYRGKGKAEFTSINAKTDALVSQSTLTNLDLMMAFTDTYVPQQASLGLGIRPTETFLIAVEGTWANWSDYEKEIKKRDVVRGEAEYKTRDLYIPRLGLEYRLFEDFFVRTGYFYEDSPFTKPGIGNVVVLDNAKHVMSLGFAYNINYIPNFTYPLTLGATYFNQYLPRRTVKSGDGIEYESKGDVNGVVGTVTIRF